MKRAVVLAKNRWQYVISILLGIIYFAFMFRFYMIDYNVPDFRAYESFFEAGCLAKDGFSTLFIWIAHFAATHPHRLTVFCLGILTLALVNMLFGVNMLLKENLHKWLIGILFSVVCGCWYYFYGKIFYDFPFSAFTYSVGFVLVVDLLKGLENNRTDKKIAVEWLVIMVIFGFMMSWKPYNIFLLVGLWLLAINNKACSAFFWNIFKKPLKILTTVICFVIGYIAGNYGLLVNPIDTLIGIKAYPANSDFIDFLFNGIERIWDHVNCVSFNKGIIAVISVCAVMFLIPLILKKWTYVCISLVMLFGDALYIYECSPGFLWHGLPYGLFILSYVIFLLRDIEEGSISRNSRKFIYEIFAIAMIYQGYNCFFNYIPMQINWFDKTEDAIAVLEENYLDIASAIEDYYYQITDAGYSVTYDNAVKRYRPCSYLGGTKFVDPLEYMIINNDTDKAWITDIRESTDTDFVIYVVPDAMLEIDDVACSRKYDNDNVITTTSGDGYEIRVVRGQYRIM